MAKPFVSIIIPLFNEEARIRTSIEKTVTYLSSQFPEFEVIAVNDGSTDKTRKILEDTVLLEPRIRPLSFAQNHGKGFAVRQGVLVAQGDVIVFTDADLSTSLEEIQRAVGEFEEGFAVVIGSRRHPGSVIVVRQGWVRERIGRCFNLLVRMLFCVPFLDTQCGFKCFSRKAALEIFSRTRIDGFAFDVEVLLIAWRLGYLIKEIPVHWINSAGTKVRVVLDSWRIARELWTIYWNDQKGLREQNL